MELSFFKHFSSRFQPKAQFLIYLTVEIALIFLYIQLSGYFLPGIGGTSSSLFQLEIPFLLLALTLLYFPKPQKTINYICIYLLPILIVFTTYISFDIFYSFLIRSPRIADFYNIFLIFKFDTTLGIKIFALILLFISFLFFLIIKIKPNKKTIAWKFCIIIFLFFLFNSEYFEKTYIQLYKVTNWSASRTIRKNGRISSFIYYIFLEKQNKKILIANTKNKTLPKDTIRTQYFPGNIQQKRNVYIIVLESFLDPRLVQDIHFDKSPLYPELLPYLPQQNGKRNFSHVISPIHGGGTAQSEFEILTGIPAFQKFGGAEFNEMLGKKMQAFTNILQQNGYYTVATIATDSQYYNAKNAYKSIGLENTFFMGDDKEQSKKWSGKTFLAFFDGVVFDYNLSNLPTYLQKNTPFFNYVLGMYGHMPFERNKTKRPDIIKTDCKDDAINRITNQFYYRTKALAQYLKKIIELDPSSLIYVTSDHLPPVFGKNIKYQYDEHVNIALLLDAGKPVNVSKKRYYEIPWLIWDILTKTQHTRPNDQKSLETVYFQAISESIYGK